MKKNLDPSLTGSLVRRFLPALFCAVLLCAMPFFLAPSAFGEQDCDDHYFGISGAPDYAKALKCYKEQKNWQFLIIMALNGEGEPADLKKADELFQAWRKAEPDEVSSLEGEALLKIIEERKADPKRSYPRLDYCNDIASDTVAMNRCGSIREQIEERKLGGGAASMKAKLTPAQAAVFDKLIQAFNVFKEAEAGRMYQHYIDGSIRNQAAFGQSSFVREKFLELAAQTVERHGLEPASEADYKAADAELNRVYRENIQDYVELYQKANDGDADKEQRERDESCVRDYKKLSKQAQLAWIKYRDLWEELALSLYADQAKTFDPATAMKTKATRIRILELQNDPVQ